MSKDKETTQKIWTLPAKTAETVPWKRVNVDLIGPYTVKTKKKEYSFIQSYDDD